MIKSCLLKHLIFVFRKEPYDYQRKKIINLRNSLLAEKTFMIRRCKKDMKVENAFKKKSSICYILLHL